MKNDQTPHTTTFHWVGRKPYIGLKKRTRLIEVLTQLGCLDD